MNRDDFQTITYTGDLVRKVAQGKDGVSSGDILVKRCRNPEDGRTYALVYRLEDVIDVT